MLLAKNDKLVMIGDSITDCERRRPFGEGQHNAGLGKGYVSIVDSMLQAVYPELVVRVINTGISGNTVIDLAERWQTDVLELEPTWLSIMIGINDVWREFDSPYQFERHVGIEEYESTLRELVKQTLPKVKGLVLMSPYYIEPCEQDAMRQKMDQYRQVVRQIASEYNTVYVDTQAAFEKVLEHLYPGAIAADRVHPNPIGHMVIARAFLDAIGFKWQ